MPQLLLRPARSRRGALARPPRRGRSLRSGRDDFGVRLLASEFLVRDVALVDPDLHADAAEGGLGLVEAVVDVRAERVQRHTTLAVELGAAHLGAAEAAGDLDADTLGAGALSALQALAHRAAEGHTGGELLGDALGDELGVGLGVLDLEDVQLDLLARELLEVGADALGLGATTTDHDARTGGVDVDADAVTGALDLDARDTRAVERRLQQTADLDVLGDVVAVTLTRLGAVGEPARHVVGGDSQTEAVWIDFLTHYLLAFFWAGVAGCLRPHPASRGRP